MLIQQGEETLRAITFRVPLRGSIRDLKGSRVRFFFWGGFWGVEGRVTFRVLGVQGLGGLGQLSFQWV